MNGPATKKYKPFMEKKAVKAYAIPFGLIAAVQFEADRRNVSESRIVTELIGASLKPAEFTGNGWDIRPAS